MSPEPGGGGTAAHWHLDTPFVGLAVEPEAASVMSGSAPLRAESESPFLAEYRLGDRLIDPGAGAVRAFLGELADPGFDRALGELLDEAQAEAERLGAGESAADTVRAERLLLRRMEPLRQEAEALIDRMATDLDTRDIAGLTESQLEEILDRYQPRDTGLAPVHEDFLGSLWNKAKKAASGAVALAKKGIAAAARVLPLGMILRRLARLVRPLLHRVIKVALDKLPPALRPYAARLADRITGIRGELGEAGEPGELEDGNEAAPAAVDLRALQFGFDAEIATLLTAADEVEQEELLAEAATFAEAEESDLLAELDEARARFVDELGALAEGADPTPVVEEFVPALLPVLRIGIRLAGRPKVVSFLAGYLGRLIAPYVGPKVTPALSQAIVDAGLRLMTLETPVEPTPRLTAEAFANVVEDTVRRVSELSDDELTDETALEEAAYAGFQEAVAASFPSGLLDPTSEYLETARPAGAWVAMPRGRRVRYRKYSRVYRVTVTPQAAKAIRTFGGHTLYSVLGGHFGPTGALSGRLHLYQAVPGSRTGRILRAERRGGVVRRPGPSGRGGVHPLTRQAAGLLLGEPGLGRPVVEAYLDREEPFAVGERLYYLEVPGAHPVPTRPSDATLAIDLRTNQIRVAVYLAESDAQAIAVRLRRREPPGASLAAIRRVYRTAIRAAVENPRGRITVLREEPELEAWSAGSMLRLARSPSGLVAGAIERWVARALSPELARQRDAFVAATAAEAEGVTLVVRLSDPPGLRAIAPLLAGATVPSAGPRSLPDLRALLRPAPRAGVEIRLGWHRA